MTPPDGPGTSPGGGAAARARRAEDHVPTPVEQLLAAREVVIVCGSGGVGKTTTAAALGAKAVAELGGRVLVLTVDPARRLANALGLEAFGNVEVRVPDEAWAEAGVTPRGELWAAMLDTKRSWDDLIVRHAPDARTRDAILANPLYTNITGRFVQSHDYIAMERLYELHASGTYDLLVVDTPPSRHALDFLDAPQRMVEFFGSRLLRWLTVPYRSRIVSVASKPFTQVADRILGSQFLQDIAEFFTLFQTMHRGFVQRAEAVSRVLADRRSTFVVVSTLEAPARQEADYFVAELARRRLHLGAVVLNKVLPPLLLDRRALEAADVLHRGARDLAAAINGELGPVDDVARVLGEVAGSFRDFSLAAHREADERAALAAAADVLVAVPHARRDIADLAGLLRVGEALWG